MCACRAPGRRTVAERTAARRGEDAAGLHLPTAQRVGRRRDHALRRGLRAADRGRQSRCTGVRAALRKGSTPADGGRQRGGRGASCVPRSRCGTETRSAASPKVRWSPRSSGSTRFGSSRSKNGSRPTSTSAVTICSCPNSSDWSASTRYREAFRAPAHAGALSERTSGRRARELPQGPRDPTGRTRARAGSRARRARAGDPQSRPGAGPPPRTSPVGCAAPASQRATGCCRRTAARRGGVRDRAPQHSASCARGRCAGLSRADRPGIQFSGEAASGRCRARRRDHRRGLGLGGRRR